MFTVWVMQPNAVLTGEIPTGILGFQSSGLTLLHSSLLGCWETHTHTVFISGHIYIHIHIHTHTHTHTHTHIYIYEYIYIANFKPQIHIKFTQILW